MGLRVPEDGFEVLSEQLTRVCFIGGVGRSGSTLLELLLARVSGVVTLGETIHLLERGLIANELCTCGELFSECAFWTAVGDEAFGGWPYERATELLELQHQVDKHRQVLRLHRPRGAFSRRLSSFVDGFMAPVFTAAQRVTGANLVVDASKHPSHAMVLATSNALDLRTVHLVRQPEGVANSWSKDVNRPEVLTESKAMPRYSVSRSSLRWLSWNLLLEVEGRLDNPTLRLRYEDLVADPVAAVDAVIAHCGGLATGLPVPSNVHGIGGNPMRFSSEAIEVVADEEWREDLSSRQIRIVEAVSAPLRRRYGYSSQDGSK